MFDGENLVRLSIAGSDGRNADNLVARFQAGLLGRRVGLDRRDDGLACRTPFRERQAMQIQLPAGKLPCERRRSGWKLHGPGQIALRTVAAAVQEAADPADRQAQHQAGGDNVAQREHRQTIAADKDDGRQCAADARPVNDQTPLGMFTTLPSVVSQLILPAAS